jgi:pyruvate formate lyase activating enzyme
MDDARHREFTGASNELILSNLRALADADANVWVRIPLVPGANTDEVDLHAFGAFIASLPKRYPVWLLPYHELGRHKHERLGLPESVLFREPSPEEVARAAEILRGYGLDVHTRNPL